MGALAVSSTVYLLAKTQIPSIHSESQVAAAVYIEQLFVYNPEGL